MVDGPVKFNYIVTDHFWQRGVGAPVTIVASSISPCCAISFCLLWFDAFLLGAYTQGLLCLLRVFDPYDCVMPCLVPDNFPCSGVCSEINIGIPAFFWLASTRYI